MSNSYVRTVGDLTGSVRNLGDYDSANTTTAYISDAFILDRINKNWKRAYEHLASADPDGATTTATYTTTTSTGSIPVPDDMWRLRAVDVKVANQWLRLIRDDPSPLNSPWELPFGTAVPGLTGVPARYRREGLFVYVAPDVPTNTTFRFTYIPAPTELTSSAQTIDGSNGADELAIWMTLRDCRVREDRPTAEADAQVAAEKQRISEMGEARDAGQPKRLEDPLTSRVGRLWRRGSFR